ncbi:MAG: response regulator [Ignavibacteriaceae bacterium]|nr:response regulator [Ignavibacteriaceae bacterium]
MKIPLKILVVEDDLITQEILALYLQEYEYVTVVASGEEAINNCLLNNFDIVLMDIRLKNGIDGVATFKKIKEIESYKETPVLAITAYAMRGDKEYFLSEGFNGYLAKPFVKDTFLDFIKLYLPQT